MSTPVACAIDVGSNSVRLLVAAARGGIFVPIFTDRITSRLYQGLHDGMLCPDSIERTAEAIAQLADEARAHGADEILGFGTSAMRDGENRDLLIDRAKSAGVELRVLTGEEEAIISYAGAAPGGQAGVIDIGGGSTELLAGEDGRVTALGSAQAGAVRLMELCGREDKALMLDLAARALEPAWKAVAGTHVDRWIGLGGTITTLAAMGLRLAKYDPDAVEGYAITAEAAQAAFDALLTMPMDERRAVAGMNPQRADIMPFGLAVLCTFFRLSGALRVSASDRDNLIGFLMKNRPEMLDNGAQMR